MILPRARTILCLLLLLLLPAFGFASAYNARPKLVVIVVIDQFRGDYLERYRDQFGEGGFKLFLDHGAYLPIAITTTPTRSPGPATPAC